MDAASKAEFDFVSGEVVGKAHGFEGVVGGGGDVGDGIEDGSIHIKMTALIIVVPFFCIFFCFIIPVSFLHFHFP